MQNLKPWTILGHSIVIDLPHSFDPAGASFAERRSRTAGGRERGIDPRGEIKLCLEDSVIVVQFNPKIWENPHPNSCTSNIIHLSHLQTKPVSLYSFSKVRNEKRPVQPKKTSMEKYKLHMCKRIHFPDGGSSHLSSDNSKEESSPMICLLFLLHPQRLTWSLKSPPWKRKNLYKPPILGFHVCYRCKRFSFVFTCQHRGTRDTFVVPNLPRY